MPLTQPSLPANCPDWSTIKSAYLTSAIGLRPLTAQHGVSFHTLANSEELDPGSLRALASSWRETVSIGRQAFRLDEESHEPGLIVPGDMESLCIGPPMEVGVMEATPAQSLVLPAATEANA